VFLAILWVGSNKYQGITAAYTQGDKMWQEDTFYYSHDTDTRGLVEENQYHDLRQANTSEGQIRKPSSWGEEASVWGSMHLEKELGLGWVPSSYPNPNFDPTACGISPTLRGDGDGVDLRHLYFCDPDKVVSDRDFGRISKALRHFTAVYGSSNTEGLSINLHKSHEDRYNLSDKSTLHSEGLSNKNYLRYESTIDGVSRGSQSKNKRVSPQLDITVGIAIARKIDVTDILREYSFYSFEDEVDTINNAAEYFAQTLLNLWWRPDIIHDNNSNDVTEDDPVLNPDYSDDVTAENHVPSPPSSGVLIFMSVEERVVFISAGKELSYILPWWRLENIVDGMKTNLRNNNYGDALLGAVNEVAAMLAAGPPTPPERAHDFITRFGFVKTFSLLTLLMLLMALCGKYRDGQNRLKSAEKRSRLNSNEEEKAKLLQYEFKATDCPICLEPFNGCHDSNEKSRLVNTDKYGIPLNGSDGLPIKMLRCGHIFDLSCWQAWVDADYDSSNKCAVCRQDVTVLHNDIIDSICSNQSSQISVNLQHDSISIFSPDDLSFDHDSTEILTQMARVVSFDSGVEYGSSPQTPLQSYGSTHTSASEDTNWDLLIQ